jgi:hypothetical protein
MSTGRAQLWTPDLGGRRRGALTDWTTQRWVQLTGRAITLAEHPWLQGPVGDVNIIGPDFFTRLAARDNLVVSPSASCGLVPSFSALDALECPTTDLVNGDHSTGSSSTPAAVAGYPSITVPAGYAMGLPVGMSLIGRAWSEPLLIKLAYAFEQGTKHRRPPTFSRSANLNGSSR